MEYANISKIILGKNEDFLRGGNDESSVLVRCSFFVGVGPGGETSGTVAGEAGTVAIPFVDSVLLPRLCQVPLRRLPEAGHTPHPRTR